MNWEDVEVMLTEVMEDSKTLKKELPEHRKAMELLGQKVDDWLQKLAAKPPAESTVDLPALKLILSMEMQKVKTALLESMANVQATKPWDILGSDARSRNFKMVFESVCKWAGILITGFCLLTAVLAHWK